MKLILFIPRKRTREHSHAVASWDYIYILLLMSYIGLLRVVGMDLLIAFNFYGALSKIVRGQPR